MYSISSNTYIEAALYQRRTVTALLLFAHTEALRKMIQVKNYKLLVLAGHCVNTCTLWVCWEYGVLLCSQEATR